MGHWRPVRLQTGSGEVLWQGWGLIIEDGAVSVVSESASGRSGVGEVLSVDRGGGRMGGRPRCERLLSEGNGGAHAGLGARLWGASPAELEFPLDAQRVPKAVHRCRKLIQ